MKHASSSNRQLHQRPFTGSIVRDVLILGILVVVTFLEVAVKNPLASMESKSSRQQQINLRSPSRGQSSHEEMFEYYNRAWKFPPMVFLSDDNDNIQPTYRVPVGDDVLIALPRDEQPDFSSLDLLNDDDSFLRIIASDDERHLRHERSDMFRDMDEDIDEYYYRFEERTYPPECMLPSWTDHQYPNCNTFHEFPLDMMLESTNAVTFLGQGYYRDSFLFHDADGESFVLKHLRIDRRIKYKRMEQIRTEGLLLEQFSSSPHFTNIFGYCEASLLVEVAKDFSNRVVPFDPIHQTERGFISRRELQRLEESQNRTKIFSFNNFTAEQKLDIATQMAEALAELHGFNSIVVHNDFDVDNFMITHTGRVVMSDLNNAKFLQWNPTKKEYCSYYSHYTGENQYALDRRKLEGDYVEEGLDIPPLGYAMFSLLTGLWPYHEYSEDQCKTVQKLVIWGHPPYINPSYRNHTLIERRMVDLLYRCIATNATDRPDVFEVVRFLRETKRLHELEASGKNGLSFLP